MKNVIATTFFAMVQERGFDKITVKDLVETCHISRQTFYYHFRDKYDLVNWIFDTEFITMVQNSCAEDPWSVLEDLCAHLYDNRSFYRKVLQIEGQNAFAQHFRDLMLPVLADRIRAMCPDAQLTPFRMNFMADGFLCAVQRWLVDRVAMMPEDFADQMKTCLMVS
jgi:probable dihydroxyacetone kinase regulator